MTNEKKDFRKKYREIRKNISAEKKQRENKKIYESFFKLPEYEKAKTVFAYVSYKDEVETLSIIEKMIQDGKVVSVPFCHTETHEMSAVIIESLSCLKEGAYGILEPDECGRKLKKDEIDLVVVPGLCFSEEGYRIGYGGGYYDRFLEGYKGFSVGLAFSDCIAKEIPTDNTDKKVDKVIFPKEG